MTKFLIYIPKVAFAFGITGNVISFMVYLAPIPTFYRIYKKKTTEGFQSLPYVVALFSAMLWIYYAMVKLQADIILIAINSVGCVIETAYVLMFLLYAPKKSKMNTIKLILGLNVTLYGLIVALTMLLWHGPKRVAVLGWVCVCCSVSVFAAPFSIMKRVVRTKSVEYMPLPLSLCLTLSAIIWFGYGFFSADIYITIPNVLGFTFGMGQIVLYLCYHGYKNISAQVQLSAGLEGGMEDSGCAAVDIECANNCSHNNNADIAHYHSSDNSQQTQSVVLGNNVVHSWVSCSSPEIYTIAELISGNYDNGSRGCQHGSCNPEEPRHSPHHEGVATEKGSPQITVELSHRITSEAIQDAGGGSSGGAAAASGGDGANSV